jgi:hypothetical protein
VNDEDKISQGFVVIRTFIFPALIEEIFELIPLLELEYCFNFKLDNLKVL